jgi:hypothetical protein
MLAADDYLQLGPVLWETCLLDVGADVLAPVSSGNNRIYYCIKWTKRHVFYSCKLLRKILKHLLRWWKPIFRGMELHIDAIVSNTVVVLKEVSADELWNSLA